MVVSYLLAFVITALTGWLDRATITVDFTPNTITCSANQIVPAQTTVRRNGSIIKVRPWFFTKNPAIASITRTGERSANVKCLKRGTTYLGSGYKSKRDSSRAAVDCSMTVAGSLALSPDSIVMATPGDTALFTAAVVNACNQVDTLIPVSFVSSDASVFTVSAIGPQKALVTAVGSGQAHLIGSAGTLIDSSKVCMDGLSLTVSPASVSIGETETAEVTAAISNCTGTIATAPTWESTDAGVATVSTGSQTATVTGVAEGDAYMRATHLTASDSSLAHVTAAPVSSTCDGIDISPGSSIQSEVSAAGVNDTFCLLAGTHRLQQVTPKAGQVFIGEGIGVTIVSGAKLLTSFNSEGSGRWSVSGQTQQGPVSPVTQCETGETDCQWPEDLWRDEVLMDRVSSLSACTSSGNNKWFFDYAADKIYVCFDPSGHTIETSATNKAFIANVANVQIKHMTVEKYATQSQNGMIGVTGNVGSSGGVNWTIENVRARHSHGNGIRVGNSWQITNVRVDENGQLGISGGGTGSVIDNLECDHNKTVGFKVGFAGGCSKFHGTTDFVIRNSFIHHNDGNGIWLDIDNIDYLVENNRVEDNFGQGIFTEISYDGVIRNNQVRRNGYERGGSWLYGAGILVAHTRNVEVYGNIVEGNWNGIVGIQQNRGTGAYGERILANLDVHDNAVCMTRGKSGVGDSYTGAAYTAGRNNKFTNNDYEVLASPTSWWTWEGGAKTFSQWQAEGMDAAGSTSVVTGC